MRQKEKGTDGRLNRSHWGLQATMRDGGFIISHQGAPDTAKGRKAM